MAQSAMAQWLRARKASLTMLSLVGGGVAVAVPLATSTLPHSLQIVGYSGHLAEWTIAAALTRSASGREFSGPLTMQHTGLCSVNGAERRTGEMRLRLARFAGRIEATLLVDNVACNYIGTLSDVYTGLMACPDQRPVPLTFWTR
jgi:hypothetical protein